MKQIKGVVLILSILLTSIVVQAKEKNESNVEDSPIWVNSHVPLSEEEFNKSEKSNTCTYRGATYSKGDEICINKTVHKCGSNGWFMINKSC